MVTLTEEFQLTPARRRLALFCLALGGFGIGVTEFATMGLLPQIAEELIPGYHDSPDTVIALAGLVVTAYALGVVVGAPIIAVLAARMSQTKLAFWLLAIFIVGSVASACMPTFGSLAIVRFIAGLPHGAFFGVASLLAARIMGPGKQGQGVALSLLGLTVANIVGVPLATWIGQGSSWRWAYVLVAVIFLATLLIGLAALPRYPGNPLRSPMREIATLSNHRMWIMMAVGAVGFGGFFAIYSYVAEVTVREANMAQTSVPLVLVCLGLGMTLGNIVGGRITDRFPRGSMLWGFVVFIVSLLAYTFFAHDPVGLIVSVFFVGATSSAITPSVQARMIRISDESALLGAALNHAAFNVGNSLGAWLGGLVIAAGFGYLAPGWVGIGLACIGFVMALISVAVQRRDRARSLNTVGIRVPLG